MSGNWNTQALEPSAFDLYREQPWDMRWVRETPSDPDSPMIYAKRTVAKVVGARSTSTSTRTSGGGARGLAALILDCHDCGTLHSPLNPCGA